jgi:hypothetical protein
MTYEELKKQFEEELVQRHERYVIESTRQMIENSKRYKYYGRD